MFYNHLERVQVETDSEFERFLHNKLDIESIAYIMAAGSDESEKETEC